MACVGAMKTTASAAAVLLLLVLLMVTSAMSASATTADATAAETASSKAAAAATGRRGAAGHGGSGRYSAHPMGLTQCVTGCGSTVTSCLLQCYRAPSANDRVLLPVCLLNCTNDVMFCAADCSTNALN